jgi:hypothetical protein
MLIEVFTLLWLHASMPNVAVKIQQNFESYCSFVEAAKTINPPAIPLTTITSHAFRKGTADVVCPNFGGKKYFEVEVNPHNQKRFKFKIFADFFGPAPCFRFDSQGEPHCNPEDGRGLPFRQILTPHFHKFNSDGVEIAFKTPVLEQENQADAIVSDYSLGVAHFCQVGRLNCGDQAYPEIIFDSGELDLSSDDPLNGVKFS